MINRRGFLGSILAASVAPALVKAESLMKLAVPPQGLVVPGMALKCDSTLIELGNESWNNSICVFQTPQSIEVQCGPGIWAHLPKNRIHPGSSEGFFWLTVPMNGSTTIYTENRRLVRAPDLSKLKLKKRYGR